jgi:hypothetical protein
MDPGPPTRMRATGLRTVAVLGVAHQHGLQERRRPMTLVLAMADHRALDLTLFLPALELLAILLRKPVAALQHGVRLAAVRAEDMTHRLLEANIPLPRLEFMAVPRLLVLLHLLRGPGQTTHRPQVLRTLPLLVHLHSCRSVAVGRTMLLLLPWACLLLRLRLVTMVGHDTMRELRVLDLSCHL